MTTTFAIRPMLASPMHKGHIANWTDWAIEPKYDGYRLMISVSKKDGVTWWTREGKSNPNDVPVKVVSVMRLLPDGLYDGELVNGETATDVRRKDLRGDAMFVVFDCLFMEGQRYTHRPYDVRRALLEGAFTAWPHEHLVRLTPSQRVRDEAHVRAFVKAVWDNDGEGAVLKHRSSVYEEDTRSRSWVKIKKVEHAVLPIVGFSPTRGTKLKRGAFAIVHLMGDRGKETTCKTLNDEELNKFENEWAAHQRAHKAPAGGWDPAKHHPAIGRYLVIEYFGRTRDGGYKGPVTWDRWAMSKVEVQKSGRGFGVYRTFETADGQRQELLEGGFFDRTFAIKCADEWRARYGGDR